VDHPYEDSFMKGRTIFDHPLRAASYRIAEFIRLVPGVATLKDSETGRYILGNEYAVEFFGLTPDEIIGKTVHDLNIELEEGGKAAFIKTIEEIDARVVRYRCPEFSRHVYITHEGFIRIQSQVKTPILDEKGDCIAIVTYDHDLTVRHGLWRVYAFYKKHYKEQKMAIRLFLASAKTIECFQELPTDAETLTMIAMCTDIRYKEVAKMRQISQKTVACHICSIHSKLKAGKDLHVVLKGLRNAYSSI
jgi:PAS domain-containing protein